MPVLSATVPEYQKTKNGGLDHKRFYVNIYGSFNSNFQKQSFFSPPCLLQCLSCLSLSQVIALMTRDDR